MIDHENVNPQIVDSVADVVTLTGAIAPSQAFGMLDTVMTETLGMAMYNAVSRQQGASMIGSAAVTAACARMVNVPIPAPRPSPLPPEPPTPPGPPVPPAPPIPDPELAAIAAETAAARDAIAALQLQSKSTSFDADNARNSLEQLEAAATPTRPDPDAPPPPPPPPSPPPPLDPVLEQIADETAAAKAAIALLQKQAAKPGFDGEMARSSLTLLIAEATAPPAPPAPAPAAPKGGANRK